MSDLRHDLRAAFRLLVRRPGFAAAIVVTLALGIGANATFFAVINATLLSVPPVGEPDRLVNVYMSRTNGSPFGALSYLDYRDLAASVSAFEGVAGYSGFLGTVTSGGRAESVFGELVTGNFFEVLGVAPVLGRAFLPEEDATPDTRAVAVLGHGFWRRWFGGDPEVVGRTVTLNGRPYTIVGVAPASFTGMLVRGFSADLWVPTMMMGHVRASRIETRNERWLFVKARLAPGLSAGEAAAEAAAVASRLAREYAATNEGRAFQVVPSGDVLINPEADRVLRPVAAMLLAAAGLVLAVACANLTGLLTARAAGRRREVAVRLALGAGRLRIVRQMLVESAMLALLGGAGALLLAGWLADFLVGFRPPLPVPLSFDVRVDARVAAYAAGLAGLTALLMGVLPALRASKPALVPALKGRAAGAARGRGWGLRQSLLVPQVAIALVLLLVAALFTRSVSRAGAVDPGFLLDRGALVALNLGQSGFEEAGARLFYDELVRRVEARPGVRAVAVTDRIPLDLYGSQSTTMTAGEDASDVPLAGQMGRVGAGYFDALGIALPRGRAFTDADTRSDAPVAIVSAEAARRLWPGADPVGRRLRLGGDTRPWLEVVGVAADVKVQSLGEAPVPFVYRPLASGYTGLLRVVARVEGDPARAVAWLREDVEALSSGVAVFDSGTLGDVLGVMLFPFRMAAAIAVALGLFTLGLAAVGLHGVSAFVVAGRRRELAIRVALGASSREVIRLVLGDALAATAAGLAVGLPVAYVAARLAGAWLFGVSPADPIALGAAVVAIVAATLAAGVVPARHAVRLDPSESLRVE